MEEILLNTPAEWPNDTRDHREENVFIEMREAVAGDSNGLNYQYFLVVILMVGFGKRSGSSLSII